MTPPAGGRQDCHSQPLSSSGPEDRPPAKTARAVRGEIHSRRPMSPQALPHSPGRTAASPANTPALESRGRPLGQLAGPQHISHTPPTAVPFLVSPEHFRLQVTCACSPLCAPCSDVGSWVTFGDSSLSMPSPPRALHTSLLLNFSPQFFTPPDLLYSDFFIVSLPLGTIYPRFPMRRTGTAM